DATGDVLSAGLMVTAPTGPDVPTVAGDVHSTLLQPFVGYVWNAGRLYVHGFTSLAVPPDHRDLTVPFNDVGVGPRRFPGGPDRPVRFVVPTVEAHVTTPLDHRGAADPVVVPDLVVLTAGVHFGLSGRSTLTLGAATPVTGPRPFDVEAIAQLNWRF